MTIKVHTHTLHVISALPMCEIPLADEYHLHRSLTTLYEAD
jgi:hypothetical protein